MTKQIVVLGYANVEFTSTENLDKIIAKANPHDIEIKPTYFTIPKNVGLEINHDGQTFYGQIDFSSEGIESAANGKMRIPLDEKYNLSGKLSDKKPPGMEFLKFDVDKYIGGGAKNLAAGIGAFTGSPVSFLSHPQSLGDAYSIETIFQPLYGNKDVKESLPENIDYRPINEDGEVGTNIVLRVGGKKVIFRNHVNDYSGNCGQDICWTNGGAINPNSIQGPFFMDYIDEKTRATELKLKVASITDSMIKALGGKRTKEIYRDSDVVTMNRKDWENLFESELGASTIRREIQDSLDGDRRRTRVYLTWDETGATLYHDRALYYQRSALINNNNDVEYLGPITPFNGVVNTTGAGDAFNAVVTVLELIGGLYLPQYILSFATAAGQMNVMDKRPSCIEKPTFDEIKRFRRHSDTGYAPVFMFNESEGKYEIDQKSTRFIYGDRTRLVPANVPEDDPQ